uniref:Uncharacterized protein n=1 Tax=Micrurus paraensis TaxID=1970185 RepID=A0A2D4KT96_9SAUR
MLGIVSQPLLPISQHLFPEITNEGMISVFGLYYKRQKGSEMSLESCQLNELGTRRGSAAIPYSIPHRCFFTADANVQTVIKWERAEYLMEAVLSSMQFR